MNRLIREGKVSAVYPERCSCRVTFPDKDDLVSAELPILQPAGAKNKFYSLVDVGDSVVCLMSPNADDGTGFVLGSRYSDKIKTPSKNKDVSMIRFDDGTYLKYDRKLHELRIKCVGKIYINGQEVRINE